MISRTVERAASDRMTDSVFCKGNGGRHTVPDLRHSNKKRIHIQQLHLCTYMQASTE